MKRTTKKLQLTTQTLRALTSAELAGAAGGQLPASAYCGGAAGSGVSVTVCVAQPGYGWYYIAGVGLVYGAYH